MKWFDLNQDETSTKRLMKNSSSFVLLSLLVWFDAIVSWKHSFFVLCLKILGIHKRSRVLCFVFCRFIYIIYKASSMLIDINFAVFMLIFHDIQDPCLRSLNLNWLTVTADSDHYFRTRCPYVPTFQNLAKQFSSEKCDRYCWACGSGRVDHWWYTCLVLFVKGGVQKGRKWSNISYLLNVPDPIN